MEEAERQARGEDVTALRDEDEREEALAAAQEVFEEEAVEVMQEAGEEVEEAGDESKG